MVTVNNEIVEFSFFRPDVQSVHLVGDFNNWQTGQLCMGRGANGYWSAKMKLPPGTYKFRYVADGVWYTDYAAFGVEPGRFGMDSVVRVEAVAEQMPLQDRHDSIAA
jgi:1,4-alpha-glucan branching enzyme